MCDYCKRPNQTNNILCCHSYHFAWKHKIVANTSELKHFILYNLIIDQVNLKFRMKFAIMIFKHVVNLNWNIYSNQNRITKMNEIQDKKSYLIVTVRWHDKPLLSYILFNLILIIFLILSFILTSPLLQAILAPTPPTASSNIRQMRKLFDMIGQRNDHNFWNKILY